MSLFANTLQIILERIPGSRVAFAERCGIPNSTLHTWVHGKAVPDVDALEKLCAQLEPTDRAELVVSHLRDQTPASARELIRILNLASDPQPATVEETEPIQLPQKLRADFDSLMHRAMHDRRVSDWISGTVDFIEGR